MLLRPYGILCGGTLEVGLEVVVVDGTIIEVRPHTGLPDPYVLSAAFVNAHSHLEYRGMQGKLPPGDWHTWMRGMRTLKPAETPEEVFAACTTAVAENRVAGVGYLAEHSDRPGAAEALAGAGWFDHFELYQEIITFLERKDPEPKLAMVRGKAAAASGVLGRPVRFALHAYYTVDADTLAAYGRGGEAFSMHVAETRAENELTLSGTGPLADVTRDAGFEPASTGERLIPTLDRLGFVRDGAQFVHLCDIDDADIGRLAEARVRAVHCPRSNAALGCPIAPVRRMREAGLRVGLGLDSAASSGPIDVFAEMRAAVALSERIGEPVSSEAAWAMATCEGIAAVLDGPNLWDVAEGSRAPLIKIHVEGCRSTEEVLDRATLSQVEWVSDPGARRPA